MGDDVFKKLHAKLEEDFTWPDVYMFKFIMKNEEEKIEAVKSIFDKKAEIQMRSSRKENYVSITIVEVMMGPDAIIGRYKEVTQIEGVIAL